ncbi:di-heme oxidoredictase family protein [Halopseudomonas pelagia]|uniref:di-heme oxidoreductase family protein n=1 Tax=Halopseudomonas pelagia TaxID=553151 RepID=UPI0003A824B2|nr:di-heme oxidoredictase family protein [Halopseudomonas pelagia]|tara:strand:- start:62060 stop:63475 length:1416 start_codon:yes stop_codon:yes gene_type:complete
MKPFTCPGAICLLLAIQLLLTACDSSVEYPLQTTPDTGGEGTVEQADHNAYSLPQSNLPMTSRLDFSVGNSFFRNPWVIAPSSTDARDGLGPLFNTNSCQGCHIKDGRGHPPARGETAVSLFLRLSVPADAKADALILKQHGFLPAPVYGSQLQTAAIPGMQPEADLIIEWAEREKMLADGTSVSLREPTYRIENPAYGPLPANLLVSPRVAPPMIGLGLLEAIPEADILAAVDPDDSNADGISGRANYVWNRATETTVLGRFGWKAAEPNVMQQSMGAFAGDMGLTSTLVPHTDCTAVQDCGRFAHGGEPEVSDTVANFVAFYARSLAVPARRDLDNADVTRGAQLFNQSGCAGCHTPRHVTGEVAGRADLSNQTIWPYTDLLLHNMGPELADGRPEFLADGNEWRTPPLWGIGLAQQINPRAGFLHDGRAETLEQAILWHGGEAEQAVEHYRQLSNEQRGALILFLESL